MEGGDESRVDVVGFRNGEFTGETPPLPRDVVEELMQLSDGLYKGNKRSNQILDLRRIDPAKEIDRLLKAEGRVKKYRSVLVPGKHVRFPYRCSSRSQT